MNPLPPVSQELLDAGPTYPTEHLEVVRDKWIWIHPRGECAGCDSVHEGTSPLLNPFDQMIQAAAAPLIPYAALALGVPTASVVLIVPEGWPSESGPIRIVDRHPLGPTLGWLREAEDSGWFVVPEDQ